MEKELLTEVVEKAIKENLPGIVGEEVSKRTVDIMKTLKAQRQAFGHDISGLDQETKMNFATDMKNLMTGAFANGSAKAALLETVDAQGGYLVPTEVHAGILRIAATNGYVMRDAQKFPMGSDTLTVPRYTGSDLEGAYYDNDDSVGDETDVAFGDATLNAKTWYTIFRVSNPLLADANADVADFLLALVAEGLSAQADKQGFIGTGAPFTGILNDGNVTVHTLSGTAFSGFTPDDAFDMIAALPESLHGSAAFYFHPTVWATLKKQKDADGNYLLGQNNNAITTAFKIDGIKPAGVLGEYPVYTSSKLPAIGASAADKEFAFFGNLNKALFLGDRQNLSVAKSDSATVGGKNVFAANQTAFRATHRHAITVGLPAAAVVVKTAAA